MEVQNLPTKGSQEARPLAKQVPTVMHVVEIKSIELKIPASSVEQEGYSQKTHLLKLKMKQAKTLQRLQQGLMSAGAKLDDGREIRSAVDSIRWVLDQINDLIPAIQTPAPAEIHDDEILDL